MLAVFPIVLISIMFILHRRVGGKPTAAVLANAPLGLVGFGFACSVLYLTAEPFGTAIGLTPGAGDLGRLEPGCAAGAPPRHRGVIVEIFLVGLLLKIAMTALIVVTASLVVERSGPFIGSLIASLPTAGGAAMIILAWEHSPAFIAQSAVGSIVSNAVCAIFALTYAALAQRRSLPVSIGGAFLVWFCCAAPRAWWIGAPPARCC